MDMLAVWVVVTYFLAIKTDERDIMRGNYHNPTGMPVGFIAFSWANAGKI